MMRAVDVAHYFLCQLDSDAGDLISNLKLQKLLYYAQGFHLAVCDEPLFEEPIEAWTHGPVVSEAYHEFKEFSSSAIPCPVGFDFSIFDAETSELLDEVYTVYGQFSAWKLREMTHEESPWRETPSGQTISHDKMKQYFQTQLVSENV
ncbi:MAG: type II toxin-antitoxin system antitoxin SocA domain-containing protein [Cyanobacteria bacterium P01_D01_bin.36]